MSGLCIPIIPSYYNVYLVNLLEKYPIENGAMPSLCPLDYINVQIYNIHIGETGKTVSVILFFGSQYLLDVQLQLNYSSEYRHYICRSNKVQTSVGCVALFCQHLIVQQFGGTTLYVSKSMYTKTYIILIFEYYIVDIIIIIFY